MRGNTLRLALVILFLLIGTAICGNRLPRPCFREPLPVPRFAEPLPTPQFLSSPGQGELPVTGSAPAVSLRVPEPPTTQETRRQSKNQDTGLTLVMISSDTIAECRAMKKILDKLDRKLWRVRYVTYEEPGASQWLEVYDITQVPYYITYQGHEALEVAMGVMSVEELNGWLDRLERGMPPVKGGRFVRSTAQDSLEAVDREYLQMRLAPGSCGMLGCMAHGGGWITETMKGEPKAKGHWEERGGCPGGTCPTQKVWVADPDPTGTVPWDSDYGRGGWLRRR